ncbi:MAG: beta-lactamase family protein [Bryobacterales bacterium]|nr:beta-lactamase family protein [Bryobacterales bacterium]
MRFYLRYIAFAAAGFAAGPEQAIQHIEQRAHLAGRMKELRVTAVSVAVIREGKISWTKAYGTATPETAFEAGPISETVAAMAALHMAQHGNFTLDEDVNGKLKSPVGRKVTLRQLLSRSVPDGFPIVQQLLMDRIGWSFPQIMERMVFHRAGMRHSAWEQPGGLRTTPGDLAQWAIELRETYYGRSNKVLERSTVHEMLTRQKDGWGLGIPIGGEGPSFHFGGGGLRMLVESGDGAVIMTSAGQNELARQLMTAIAAEYRWPEGWDR